MPDPVETTSLDARLAERARVDALRLSPGFSHAMHQRVIEFIQQAASRSPQISQARPATARFCAGALALAAAVAMLVTPILFLKTNATPPPLAVRPSMHPHELAMAAPEQPRLNVYTTAHEVNFKVQDAVQTAMAQEQFAGLDHDLRAATAYLVDQVPLRSAWERHSATRER